MLLEIEDALYAYAVGSQVASLWKGNGASRLPNFGKRMAKVCNASEQRGEDSLEERASHRHLVWSIV